MGIGFTGPFFVVRIRIELAIGFRQQSESGIGAFLIRYIPYYRKMAGGGQQSVGEVGISAEIRRNTLSNIPSKTPRQRHRDRADNGIGKLCTLRKTLDTQKPHKSAKSA